jgi:hypothetical protein
MVEEVAHGVDKDHSWFLPLQRFRKLLWNKTDVEALFEGVSRDSAKSLSKSLRIAIFAASADLATAAHRVPRCIRPLD